jgi:hypothetical protein
VVADWLSQSNEEVLIQLHGDMCADLGKALYVESIPQPQGALPVARRMQMRSQGPPNAA